MARPEDTDPFYSPTAFCRHAVTYIAHPTTVRTRCLEHFDSAPSIAQIARLRREHQRKVDRFRRIAERRGEAA